MQIIVTARHTDITPAIRDYAQKKVVKLEEFFKNIQKVEVVLDIEHISDTEHSQMAEIRAWMAGHKMIQAKESARDAYAAIDLVLEEAKRQVKKHKDKLTHEHRREAMKSKHDVFRAAAEE